MKPNLSIAYGLKRLTKKMASGGMVNPENMGRGYDKTVIMAKAPKFTPLDDEDTVYDGNESSDTPKFACGGIMGEPKSIVKAIMAKKMASGGISDLGDNDTSDIDFLSPEASDSEIWEENARMPSDDYREVDGTDSQDPRKGILTKVMNRLYRGHMLGR